MPDRPPLSVYWPSKLLADALAWWAQVLLGSIRDRISKVLHANGKLAREPVFAPIPCIRRTVKHDPATKDVQSRSTILAMRFHVAISDHPTARMHCRDAHGAVTPVRLAICQDPRANDLI
jgi:hypothetical protein